MKKETVLISMLMILLFVGTANASLTMIGTATYGGGTYNLIYEDDSINGGLVWLDYTSGSDTWQNQMDWASDLNGTGILTYNLNPGITVTWDGDWRLPITDESKCNMSVGFGYEGPDATGYHNYSKGYNMVNSELGHLFYESLGNLGSYATDGTYPQPGSGLQQTGDFNFLQSATYWSGTEYSPYTGLAWLFYYSNGSQLSRSKDYTFNALAVRPGQVSAVPLPGAVWLLGTGLTCFGLIRRKVGRRHPVIV